VIVKKIQLILPVKKLMIAYFFKNSHYYPINNPLKRSITGDQLIGFRLKKS